MSTRAFAPNASGRRLTVAMLAAMLCFIGTACSLVRPATSPTTETGATLGAVDVVERGPLLFEGPLKELYPCNDGDMVAYRVEGGPRSGEIMVSRTFALKKPGDFRVANTFDGELIEALHLRLDGSSLLVVSQVDTDQDVGITFARPLPLVSVPLHAGVTSFRTPVRIWRPSSGRTMGDGEVTLNLSVKEDPLDGYGTAFATTQAGMFKLLRQEFEVASTAWLVPGLGEVQAQRIQPGTETETYALVCARIGGKEIVDCGAVDAAIEK